MPERLDHALSIARCASRNKQHNASVQVQLARVAGQTSPATHRYVSRFHFAHLLRIVFRAADEPLSGNLK